jgi:hypothetical protein
MTPTTLLAFLTAFALSLSNGKYIPKDRLDENVRAVQTVVTEDGAIDFPGSTPAEDVTKTEELMLVMANYETAFDKSPVGDGGRSCGPMQTNPFYAHLTCDELKGSYVVGYRAGLKMLKHHIEICRGIEKGLGRYATGTCGGAPKLVKFRLSLIGR